jgi:hypothetical protein
MVVAIIGQSQGFSDEQGILLDVAVGSCCVLANAGITQNRRLTALIGIRTEDIIIRERRHTEIGVAAENRAPA